MTTMQKITSEEFEQVYAQAWRDLCEKEGRVARPPDVRNYGFVLTEDRKKIVQRRAELVKILRDGHTVAEASRRLKVSHWSLYEDVKALRKAGVAV